jgi:predicted enzyme related to lactoylglutathione lyase
MTDPFEALREPMVPVEPDGLFAAHLRARLVRALALPQRVTVSNLTLDSAQEDVSPSSTIVPYLIVANARRALGWYAEAMGAQPQGEPIVMPAGRIGHAELRFGGATIYLADAPSMSADAPPMSEVSAPGKDVSLTFTVPDVDRLVERAVAAGARLERAAADYDHGRNAVIRDPFGHRWIVSALEVPSGPRDDGPTDDGPTDDGLTDESPTDESPTDESPKAKSGDIAYVSLWVPDDERAADFFSAVLGWEYQPAGDARHARQLKGQSLAHGIFGHQGRSTLFLCFYVAGLDRALDRVRDAGGQAEAPDEQPYGRIAGCVDNQGVRFALVELGDQPGPRGPGNGARPGDLAYLTVQVVDSAKARVFYESVLGWRFTLGQVEDGWGTDDVVPMLGLHGGNAENTVVPMYLVDDIAAAVARVRSSGGTSTDPEQQPYGVTADCVDDQGTRFYLGRL